MDDAPALKTSVHTAVADNGWRPEHSAGPRSDSHGAVALDSLQRRVRGMHALWLEALATMSAEHVNHFERPGVLPIAFTVNHQPRMEDFAVSILSGETMEWTSGNWAARTGVVVDDIGKDTTVEQMEAQRIEHYDVFVDYCHVTYHRTEHYLEQLDPDSLTEIMFGGHFPDAARQAYIHRVVRDEQITVLDAAECWIYQHGIRHLGELEHARALVGLGGLTS